LLTIAVILNKSGQHRWYLGGNIAEEGVGKDPDVLIEKARAFYSNRSLRGLPVARNSEWATQLM